VTAFLSTTLGRRLRDRIFRRRAEWIDLLEAMVRAESPSTDPAAQGAIWSILGDALLACGYRLRYRQGKQTGGYLLAVPRDRRPDQANQLILGHCDTVWPLGTLDRMPFRHQGNKIRGPGSYDMKAGLVQLIFALQALRAEEIHPALAPLVLINSDEEIGSPESTAAIRRLAQIGDRAFVLEPSFGEAGKIKTQRKGVGKFTIEIEGKAAHAGLEPEKGASAILELSFVIQQLFALNDPARGITVNVGTIDGGLRSNVVAPASRAIADVRALRAEDALAIERQIYALQPTTPGTKLIVSGHFGRLPLEKTPQNQDLWRQARAVAAEDGLLLEEAIAGGGSDGNTTSLYIPTLDGLGAVGDAAHAPEEFIWLDATLERTALLARLLLLPASKADRSRTRAAGD
jgi:glutamate carboxypeptidase